MLPWLPLAAFFALVVMFMVIGTLMLRLMSDPIRDRLEALARGETRPESASFLEGLAQQLPEAGPESSRIDRDLRRAGYYRPTARTEFLALRNGLMMLVILLAGFIIVLMGPEEFAGRPLAELRVPRIIVFGVVAAGLCWALPRIVLQMQGNRRVRKITGSLPYALDMITMSISGGLSLQDALYQVSRELYYSHPDLAIELLIIRQHAELSSLELAFEQFSRRIDSPDVASMSALVRQGQRLGTDVVQAINDYSDDLRLKRRQLADAKSSRASVHMLLPVTLLLMPAVMIILWGPSIIELLDFIRNRFEGPQIPPGFGS